MKLNRWSAVAVAVLLVFMVSVSVMGAVPPPASEKVDVLIGFHGTPNPGLVRAFGGEIYREFTIVDVISARLSTQAADALANNPAVRYIEPNHPVYAMGQTIPWGINRVFGSEEHLYLTWVESTGVGVKVAVIDTGIDVNHEDLDVAGGRRFRVTGFRLRADDNFDDDHGHGTHVAGTIAALNNEVGVVGVAPDVELYAVKVLDSSGSGRVDAIIAGIEWAVDEGIHILNMSLGTSFYSEAFEDACEAASEADRLLISSAGNSGTDDGDGENVTYPAKFGSVIAVAASDADDERASFSSTGPEVELIAPGVSIYSTYYRNRYATASGTSMASPHVAGVAALVWAANPDLTNVELRKILQDTAEDLGLPSNHQGHGLVRADLAVREVGEVEPPATGNIEGTVKDEDGAAIEEATVLVEGTGLSATTDENGSYLLENAPAGDQKVTASADGYYSETAPVTVEEDATITQDFTLEAIPTYTVSGTVTDTDDFALEGATVTIEETGQSATTDEHGAYEISDVEKGTYDITASKSGYSSQTKTVTVESDTPVHFVLESLEGIVRVESITYSTRGGRLNDRHLDITLQLLDDQDDPVAGASVSATLKRDDGSSWDYQGTTGSGGTVTFTLNNHGSGCYETEVTAVEAEGLEWDGVTPENGYPK